jgi:HEAT repeat protein
MSTNLRCSRCFRTGPGIQEVDDGEPLCAACRQDHLDESTVETNGRRSPRRAEGQASENDVKLRTSDSAFEPRRRKRKRRRRVKRSMWKPLVAGIMAVVLLVGIALTVQQMRSRRNVSLPPSTPLEEVPPVAVADKPIIPAEQTVELLPLPQPFVEPVAAALAKESVPEQLVVMPALAMNEPEAPAPRQPRKLIRRSTTPEEALREHLFQAPVIGLTGAQRKALADAYEAKAKIGVIDFQPGPILEVRPDLAMLPMRTSGFQLSPSAAATLATLSRKLHVYVDNATPKDVNGQRVNPVLLRQIMHEEKRGKKLEWVRPEAVPVLRQVLQHEQRPIRALLVELLTEIPGQKASELLAERAVFDLSPEIRAAAVEALRSRPFDQFRHVLTGALRYPWPPAAGHAAEALAALDDRDSLPYLVTLLKLPDPSAPYRTSRGILVQREMVRLNHNASCLICHAPAFSTSDPVIGVVPGLVRQTGGGYGTPRRTSPFWVRADVVFFRQDFSDSLPIGPADTPGHPDQRWDFLVRTRPVKAKEAKRLEEEYAGKTTYEQREAVLFVLRELTGRNPGSAYEDWLALYPTAEIDTDAARLAERLLRAPPGRREQVLIQLRDGKTAACTQALARAILRLPEADRSKTREALAKRLTRQPADAVRELLHDPDPELRRAAAGAARQLGDTTLVGDLIPLLKDAEPIIAIEARLSLKELTGKDHGDSAKAWEEWYKAEGEFGNVRQN